MSATFVAKTEGDTGVAAATSVVVTMPSPITAGDRLVVAIQWDFGFGTITPPAGWTLLASQTQGGHLRYYTRKATGSEAATYTWTWTTGSSAVWACVLYTALTKPDDGWDTCDIGVPTGSGGSPYGAVMYGRLAYTKNILYVYAFGAAGGAIGTLTAPFLNIRVNRGFVGTSYTMFLVVGELVGAESPYFYAPRVRWSSTGVATGGTFLVNQETTVDGPTADPVLGIDHWSWTDT